MTLMTIVKTVDSVMSSPDLVDPCNSWDVSLLIFLCLVHEVVGSLLSLGISVGSLPYLVWVTDMTGDACSLYIRRMCHRTLDPCGRHMFWLNFTLDKIIASLVLEWYCHILATLHNTSEDGAILWYWRRLDCLREKPSKYLVEEDLLTSAQIFCVGIMQKKAL